MLETQKVLIKSYEILDEIFSLFDLWAKWDRESRRTNASAPRQKVAKYSQTN